MAAALSLVVCLASCGQEQGEKKAEANVIYCIDEEEDALGTEQLSFEIDQAEPEGSLKKLVDEFAVHTYSKGHSPLLPETAALLSYALSKGVLTLDFSEGYYEMDRVREVLVRAGLVWTFVQIEGISKVAVTVAGEPLVDVNGEEVGPMEAADFIENSGRQINNYSNAYINLYFADGTGTQLVRESRSIYYSSSQPLEWALVGRIIEGPKGNECYPCVPGGTKIISVATSGKTCYVNLSAEFAAGVSGVDPRVTIYSIVNALIENCGVSSVQFAIAGESNVMYKDTVDLQKPLTQDLSLLKLS